MDNSTSLSNVNHSKHPKEQINICSTNDKKAFITDFPTTIRFSIYDYTNYIKHYSIINYKEKALSNLSRITEFLKKFNYGEKFNIFLINNCNYNYYGSENSFSIYSKKHQESDSSEKKLYIAHIYHTIPTSFNEQYLADQIEHYMNHNDITLSKFKGFSMTDKNNQFVPTVLTERPVNGPLSSLFNKGISLNNAQKYCMVYGVAKGIELIHRLGYVHSNLNPATVYLDENFFPKICDYIFIPQYKVETIYDDKNKKKYEFKTNEKSNFQKSPFTAPELFEDNRKFDQAVDVYSFGMILYNIIVEGQFNIEKVHLDSKMLLSNIEKVHLDSKMLLSNIKKVHLDSKFSGKIDGSIKELIEKCWSEEPSSRPKIEETVEFLSEHRNEFLPSQISAETFLYLSELDNKPKVIDIVDKIVPNIDKIDKQTQTIIKAAERGHIESLEKVASYFLNGEHNLFKDQMWSYSCFKKAGELGSVNSMIECAKMLENGVGVERSFLIASRIYKLAYEKMDANDPERSTIESKFKETEEKTRILKIRALSDQITTENIKDELNLPFQYEVSQIEPDENSFELKFSSQKEKTKSMKEIRNNKKFELFDHKDKTGLFDLLDLPIPLLNADDYYQGKDNEKFIKVYQSSSSEIYKVYNKSTEKIYAAKVLKLENEDEINRFKREINIMLQVNNSIIVSIIGYCNCDITENKELRRSSSIKKATIIADFVPIKTLKQAIKEKLDSTKKLITILGVAMAMNYLHERDIIHGDLTPSNILIDEDFAPHIADFGLSKSQNNSSFDHSIENLSEKSVYMAPELFISDPVYSKEVDAYAFGFVMCQILQGQNFKSRFKSDLSISEILKIKMSKNQPDFSMNLHPIFADLIKRCCDVSIDSRPDFQTICSILIGAVKRREKLLDGIDFDFVENYMLNSTKCAHFKF